jgi:uncharacterized protein YbjT (DUF2867 family)
MSERLILVLGATGGQGGAVVAVLLSRGTAVRAMVRRPDQPSARRLAERGVDVAAGTLDDRAALGAAMHSVDAVFALTTPFESGVDAEVAQGRAILAAAAEAQVPHLVFSSVASADQHTGVPHFESKAIIEKDLASSGLRYTIIGPTYFFDNALGGRTASAPGFLTCRCRRIVRCSSWPDRIWQPSSRKYCWIRGRMPGSASSWPVTP